VDGEHGASIGEHGAPIARPFPLTAGGAPDHAAQAGHQRPEAPTEARRALRGVGAQVGVAAVQGRVEQLLLLLGGGGGAQPRAGRALVQGDCAKRLSY
jgi:hypothetical protein